MATYGIDLGTTYSCIACVDKSGRPVVLKNANGDDTTPSVVWFESADNVVVGRQAKDSAILFPDAVAQLVKRDIGMERGYTFNGQEHTPETISALILRELARAAGEQTGETVRDVVITVPAYFGVLEREATRRAGEIAGLDRARRAGRAGGGGARLPGAVGQQRGAAYLRLRPRRRHLRHHRDPDRRQRHRGRLHGRRPSSRRRRLGRQDQRFPAQQLHQPAPRPRP